MLSHDITSASSPQMTPHKYNIESCVIRKWKAGHLFDDASAVGGRGGFRGTRLARRSAVRGAISAAAALVIIVFVQRFQGIGAHVLFAGCLLANGAFVGLQCIDNGIWVLGLFAVTTIG